MRLLDLVYKSLSVRRGKSLFLIIGLCIGIVTIITLLSATEYMQTSLDETLRERGVKLQLAPNTKQLQVVFNGITVVNQQVVEQRQISAETLDGLRAQISGMDAEMLAKHVSLASIGSRETVMVVTDIEREIRANSGWMGAEDIQSTDVKALIGRELASQIPSADISFVYNDREITLDDTQYGVIEQQGNEQDGILLIDRSLTEEVSQVNFVELHVKTDDIGQITFLETQLSEKFPELQIRYDWGSLQARQELFSEFKNYTSFTIVTIIAVGLFLVSSTMMASVNERNREFGILRTCGYRKRHIVYIVFMETGLLFVSAYVIAVIIGAFSSGVMLGRIFDNTPPVYLSVAATVGVGIVGLLISSLAAAYPALKAANLDPVDAVR